MFLSSPDKGLLGLAVMQAGRGKTQLGWSRPRRGKLAGSFVLYSYGDSRENFSQQTTNQ